jgi:hypothetical protein
MGDSAWFYIIYFVDPLWYDVWVSHIQTQQLPSVIMFVLPLPTEHGK